MLAVSMAVSALVIAVGALGVAWWIMSALLDIERRMDSKWALHDDDLAAIKQQIHRTTPESLKVAVDDLVGAHAAHRAAVRREFGSIWGRLGGRTMKDALHIDVPDHPAPAPSEAARIAGLTGGDFDAMIALQSAPPAKP